MKVATFLLLVFISVAISVHAFEVKEVSLSSGLRLLRWDTTQGPIKITLNSKGSDDLPLPEVENVVRNALNEWQSVAGQSVTFQYVGTSATAVENGTDLINSIVWIEKGWEYSSSVLGVTKYSYFLDDPPTMADVDIIMNGEDFQWKTGSTGPHPQQVLMHEFGHLLGFSHSSVLKATLYPFLFSTVKLNLSKDDKSAIKFLYGEPGEDFKTISPIQGSAYAEMMSDQGLPLPVFRWGKGGLSSFTIEFSASKSFDQKKTVSVGQDNFYALTAKQEEKLLKLSPVKNVFWRVTSGNSVTNARVMRFRTPGLEKLSLIGAVAIADDEIEDAWKFAALLFSAGLVISILLIILMRLRKLKTQSVQG